MGNYACVAKKHVINQTVKARPQGSELWDENKCSSFFTQVKKKIGSTLNMVRRTSLESFYLFAQIVLTKVAVIFIIVPFTAVNYRVVTCVEHNVA